MRVLAILLVVSPLVLGVTEARAQTASGNRTPNRSGLAVTRESGGAMPVSGGTNTNANALTTGSNQNTNVSSNSQFLSGGNAGVNNGALEIYSGADPYQGIVLKGSVNLPQLPSVMPAPSNFSQPYKPETFVNTPAFLPAGMTRGEANGCRDSKVAWYGGARESVQSIRLFYATKHATAAVPMTMASYVGTATARVSDGPFVAALCEAAYAAMGHGASVGLLNYSVRPRNTMSGTGFGAAGGATGLPAAGAHPYAIAGTLGFGTGWSSQRVEGEVVVQLTGLSIASTAVESSASAGAAVPSEETAAERLTWGVPDAPTAGVSSRVPRPPVGARLPSGIR
jgi:hypothetical protein